jgi:hypothetical protein
VTGKRGRPAKRGIRPLLFAGLALASVALIAVPASASAKATRGTIAGTVTSAASSSPIEGVEVCATATGAYSSTCADTGSDGSYSIGSLEPGTYNVGFEPRWLDYLFQYYDGAEDREEAGVVTVEAGSTIGSIDAAMQPGGGITGTVTAADDHAPLQGILVCLHGENAAVTSCISTRADGTYAFSALAAGNYTLEFSSQGSANYVRQFYSGKATHKTADPVTVTAGETRAGIDAEMQTGGKIAGTVTDAATHEPIGGLSVCADFHDACATTDSSGSYEIPRLPTGSFEVRFGPDWATGYLPQYYDGNATLAEAEAIPVTAGESTGGVDAAMVEGASISGTVTDASSHQGAPLVQVCARDPGNGNIVRCDQTDAEGRYSIVGLVAGAYAVRFSPGYAEGGGTPNRNYLTQYYDAKATLAEAEPVTVGDGAKRSGIDAVMHEGGEVSGRVTAASDGAPLIAAEVCPYVDGQRDWEHCTSTDGEGEYVLAGLPAGSYAIRFGPTHYPFAPSNYAPRTVEGVSVVAEQAHEHVDAALSAGGQITGHVTDASTGESVFRATACALEPGGEEEAVACDETNAHGKYTISRLPTGSYEVEFSDLRYPYGEEQPLENGEPTPEEIYVRQFWSGSASAGSAATVAVTEGSVVGCIDASLVPAGGYSGPFEPAAGCGESPGGSGSAGAANVTPPSATTGTEAAAPSLARKARHRLKCRKGFAKRRVRGKTRCVRVRHAKHRRHHPHHRG